LYGFLSLPEEEAIEPPESKKGKECAGNDMTLETPHPSRSTCDNERERQRSELNALRGGCYYGRNRKAM